MTEVSVDRCEVLFWPPPPDDPSGEPQQCTNPAAGVFQGFLVCMEHLTLFGAGPG